MHGCIPCVVDAECCLFGSLNTQRSEIPSIRQEILVPTSAYLCQFCDSAMEVQAAVDLSNGASLRGRLTRFEQRCAALCEDGKEWTLVEPRVRAVPDQTR